MPTHTNCNNITPRNWPFLFVAVLIAACMGGGAVVVAAKERKPPNGTPQSEQNPKYGYGSKPGVGDKKNPEGRPKTKPGQAAKKRKPPVAKPPQVRKITLKEMTFPDRSLGKKFRRFDAIANRIARPGWYRKPYTSTGSYQGRGVYIAEWADFSVNNNLPYNYYGPRESHYFSLSADFDAVTPDLKKRKEIAGIRLDAHWTPSIYKTGWAIDIRYNTFHGRKSPRTNIPEYFHIYFRYFLVGKPGLTAIGFPHNFPAFGIHHTRWASYQDSFAFGGPPKKLVTHYSFNVLAGSPNTAILPRKIPDANLRRILASPEAMRDEILASLEALVKKIEVEIPSGRALTSARYPPTKSPHPSPRRYNRGNRRQPPVEQVKYSKRPLTEQEKRHVLNHARRNVKRRMKIVREHYREMYKALEKAFPLQEALGVEKVKP